MRKFIFLAALFLGVGISRCAYNGIYPIEVGYAVSGATLYAILHNPDGEVFSVTNNDYETYSQSNWAQYALALTEQAGSSYYRADAPTASTGTLTTSCIYVQAGTVPALGDIIIGIGQTSGSNIFTAYQSVTAASNFGASAGSEVQAQAASGTLSTTQMSTTLSSSLTNQYQGRTIIWISGLLTGTAAGITAYDGTTHIITFTAVPIAPSVGDAFVII